MNNGATERKEGRKEGMTKQKTKERKE